MLSVTGKQLIQPASASTALPAEMREYLNLADGVDANAFLSSIYLRAASIVELHTGVTLLPATWIVHFDGTGKLLRLPFFPVSSVISQPGSGVQAGSFTLRRAAGYNFDVEFTDPVTGPASLQVSAGYSAPEVPPPALSAAVFAIAADLYEHREAQSEANLTESRTIRRVLDSLTFYHAGGV